jgi:ATP-binding protein involved in chromosome partitioning
MLSPDAVLTALKSVIDPDLRKDIVSLGFVKNLAIDDGRVSFTIELTRSDEGAGDGGRRGS